MAATMREDPTREDLARENPAREAPRILAPATRPAAGFFWFGLCLVAALPLFWFGLTGLATAWARPEYSHGPIIPLLSFYLYLREMRAVPPPSEPVTDRGLGIAVIVVSLLLAAFGNLVQIGDFVFYALIVWTYGLILTCWGARRGWVFWPSVLHLVFMLPLPQFLYWKLNISLQFLSSEIGVWALGLTGVPVYLDGNVIDLGIYKLQVAEACSGLRYLFPIMSFSYVFAMLYRGPLWMRLALLVAAVPLAVGMNALRIAAIGVMVDRYGIAQAEGFLHVFEGWVIFLACIAMLFLLVLGLQRLTGDRRPLGDAIDLDFSGLGGQVARVLTLPASRGLIAAALLTATLSAAWALAPRQVAETAPREPFVLFPHQIGAWTGTPMTLDPAVARALGSDDYLSAYYRDPAEAEGVDLFLSYYRSQTEGAAIHSPEVCLPAGGWEVSAIETLRLDLPGTGFGPLTLNRAVIQKGLDKQLVYYWFEGRGRHLTNDFAAKFYTMADSITRGRTDGGLVRVITPIDAAAGGEDAADARLQAFLGQSLDRLPPFLPE
jgi:exosortase D (VPLPA-CTERM-specific)